MCWCRRKRSGGGRHQAASRKLGYVALTKAEFNKRITDFYTYKTGIGTNILLMTVISFIVGLPISGQTFYTFILENLEKFGALKAIGAKGARARIYMILFMATFTALTGYGLGVGLVTLMIWITRSRLPQLRPPMITFGNLGLAFGMVVLIAGISTMSGSKSTQNRALRHFQGIAPAQPAFSNWTIPPPPARGTASFGSSCTDAAFRQREVHAANDADWILSRANALDICAVNRLSWRKVGAHSPGSRWNSETEIRLGLEGKPSIGPPSAGANGVKPYRPPTDVVRPPPARKSSG